MEDVHPQDLRAQDSPTTTTPHGQDNLSQSEARNTQSHAVHPSSTSRTLRTRRSLPVSLGPKVHPAVQISTVSSPTRVPTEKELEVIRRRLGPEAVQAKREELLKEKESALRDVIDGHDDAVREKFHLERFVTVITGWDPKMAKTDNSPVFLDYKRFNHSLLDLAPPSLSTNAVAGPSRPRSSLPSRQTRRQAHEQEGILTGQPAVIDNPIYAPQPVYKKGKARVSILDESVNGVESVEQFDDVLVPAKSKGKGKIKVEAIEEPESAELPFRKGRSRPSLPLDVAAEEVPKKGKKGRQSMPILPEKKGSKRKLESEKESEPPPIETPRMETPPTPRESTPPPPPLPSLAHLPFPPAPPREPPPKSRAVVRYTDPNQLPPPPPKYQGDITSYLSSYIHMEDTGPPPELKSLELRANHTAYIRNRVNYLQNQGRLSRLLDEDPNIPSSAKIANKPFPSNRKTDHRDHLVSHMIQVRKAMLDEAKNKPFYAKRIARMITVYWERILGKEDRERLEMERELKRKVREVMKALRNRWKLAVKIVRARRVAAQKEAQDRLGKEHLQSMLQRSSGLLEAQQTMVEEEDESDGTEDVSEAEESDDGEKDEADGENGEMVEAEQIDEVDGEDQEDKTLDDPDLEDEAMGSEEDDRESSSQHNQGLGEGAFDYTALLLDDQTELDGTDKHGKTPDQLPDVNMKIEGPGALSQPASSPTTPPAAIGGVIVQSTNSLVKPQTQANGQDSDDTAHQPNGHGNGSHALDTDILLDDRANIEEGVSLSSNAPIIRPRRARKVGMLQALPATEDPDADDVEFEVNAGEIDDQDVQLDVDMEEAENSDDEAENEGLLADADVPIEELLKRYGYGPLTNGVNGGSHDEDGEIMKPNGHVGDGMLDQSLLDHAVGDGHSPSLVIEGKRQRRTRQVWTPEDNPQHLAKKPKVEEVESDHTVEMTPSIDETDEEEGEDAQDEEEDSNAPKTRVPFLLRGVLRPYQHAGLDWLAGLYSTNMNGILADEMGLGKTIQTISLLAHLACEKGVWGQHLIIVPTSVILNWEMEFKKFLPGFKVLTYYGNQKERKEKRVGWLTENAWQVCITSYQIVLADQHIFRRKSWVYMILDEAHNIKNFRSQRWQTLLGFKAQRRLLLTGTPLQNNLMELWSLLYFLMPHGVAEEATAVVGFANHKDFMEWFSNPMDKAVESGDYLDEEALATVAKLHTLLRPFILRRLKSEVETQLPGKFEHIVYCRLSKRQRFLYDEFMSRSSTKEALTSGGYLGVMNTLMQLRKVCNHPDLFEVRPVRTSFAMPRSVASDFVPVETLVRKRLIVEGDKIDWEALNLLITRNENTSTWSAYARKKLDGSDLLPQAINQSKKHKVPPPPPMDTRTVEGWLKYKAWMEEQASVKRWRSIRDHNRSKCQATPIYGSTFLSMVSSLPKFHLPPDVGRSKLDLIHDFTPPSARMVLSLSDRARLVEPLVETFAVIPPNAIAKDLAQVALPTVQPGSIQELLTPEFDTLHHASTKLQIAFPDSSLLQYDCGKLQKLSEMLRDLKQNGHRVLIFTQMTRVLDILEIFLSYSGHRYLRLDGSTKIEDRQIITERFNTDNRIFCFIASSRSGGVGINLTGADTVFFYDSDWNPSMDRQCMDRAHRIGQTREVHIYRFVSSHTVEENMLKKANQKRLLDKVVIQEGDFTTEFFGKVDWRETIYDSTKDDLEKDGVEDIEVEDEPEAEDIEVQAPRRGEEREFAKLVEQVEDEEDVAAAKIALGEGEMDLGDFDAKEEVKKSKQARFVDQRESNTPITPAAVEIGGEEMEVDGEDDEDDVGGIDEYILRMVDWDWNHYSTYR